MATNPKDAVERQFDQDSDGYLARYLTAETRRQQQRMIALLGTRTHSGRILDLGCGPGTMADELLKVCDELHGVDISERMIATATSRFKGTAFEGRVAFQTADAERLPFPAGHFDAVVCAGVLRYLPSLETGLQEIRRVLKPDGVAVMTFYYRFSPHWFSMCLCYRPLLPLISLLRGRSLKECRLKYRAEPLPFSYRQFRKTMATVGLHHLKTQHSGFDIFPLNRLLPGLSRFCYLKAEPILIDARLLGWLGSICIVQGSRQRHAS